MDTYVGEVIIDSLYDMFENEGKLKIILKNNEWGIYNEEMCSKIIAYCTDNNITKSELDIYYVIIYMNDEYVRGGRGGSTIINYCNSYKLIGVYYNDYCVASVFYGYDLIDIDKTLNLYKDKIYNIEII